MSKNEPRITVDGKTAPCPECHISGDHKMSCSRGGSKGARFTMRMEHAADAVTMLQRMHACVVLSENHGDVPRVSSDEVLAALRAVQAERARHAEEVAEACRQKELWRQETASLQGAVRKLMDQLEEARVTSLRSLLPDVRACAEDCENRSCPFEPGPVGIAARNILAALDSQGGEGSDESVR